MTARSKIFPPGAPAKLFVLALLVVLTVPAAHAERAEPARGFFGIIPRVTGDGVKVAGVTPCGPAQEAGIQEGDILVLVNGKPPTPTAKEGVFAPFIHFNVGDQA